MPYRGREGIPEFCTAIRQKVTEKPGTAAHDREHDVRNQWLENSIALMAMFISAINDWFLRVAGRLWSKKPDEIDRKKIQGRQ